MPNNVLAIDYGTKNIGLAYAVNGIIATLPPLKNDVQLIARLMVIIKTYDIGKIYVGVSEGRVAKLTLGFVAKLKRMLKLPVETVEEAVSTIEAADIISGNRHSRKNYDKLVDSVAAAVILRRVIS